LEDLLSPHHAEPVEHALRTIAITRKNFLFLGSEAGGERAAILYTVLAFDVDQRQRHCIGGRQCEKLTESAEAGPIGQALDRRDRRNLCGRSDQTDYLCGEIGKEAPRLMTNTSIRMLRCGATVSWPSGCWWSADGIGFTHP